MCGIVGYIGDKNASDIILAGLHRLEYRGYDSSGIAIYNGKEITVRRKAGKLERLIASIAQDPVIGMVGIGHTRWATHGIPNSTNAHPHIGQTGRIVIVHNGIVENFTELKEEMIAGGTVFQSETDTEVIAHLIEGDWRKTKNIFEALRLTLQKIRGAHGIVVFCADEPEKLVAARVGNAGGVVIGFGDHEMFVASDIPAILDYSRVVTFLESGEIAVITTDDAKVYNFSGNQLEVRKQSISWDPVSAEKGEYRHFMQKEMHEQVRSITDTLAGRVDFDRNLINLPELHLDEAVAKTISKIFITACGTAAHSGMIGRFYFEALSKITTDVEIASEFRYRDPIIPQHAIVLAISQSGETADTLAAMEEGRKKGATLWSIVNSIGSQAMRIADGAISMQVGPEIGVASTKAFTAPIVDLYLIALQLAALRNTLNESTISEKIQDIRKLPDAVGKCLDRENEIEKLADHLLDVKDMLYLGRGINMPIAYEGALKLKEISYIHAEGYPAGEMKHGPIALIDQSMPVIAICTNDPWREKMISQIEQTKARGGLTIAVATDGDDQIAEISDHVIWVPHMPWLLSPIVNTIPLQLLAYHIAVKRGLDVDQPRNLAKSVTVE